MQIEILTIFPGYFESPLRESLLGRAVAGGRLEVTVTDLRAFAQDRHRKVDDEPYGGGPGMIMMAPVVAAAIEGRREVEGLPRAWTVLMGPEERGWTKPPPRPSRSVRGF
jgi:tRNA (guanine37-N1)-methyltransferase